MQNQKAVNQYEKARVFHQKGRLLDAERSYKKAIKNNKNFVEAYNNLGNVLVDRGRLKEASDTYRKALKLLPDHPMLLNNLGNSLQLQGDNEKAISWLNKAISQDSKYADAYCNLGNALRDSGEAEEAVASYERSIQIDPTVADPYNNLGGMQLELGETDAAVKNFKKAISIDSRHKEACNGLGNALLVRGEVDGAIDSYSRAIDIDPNHKDAYFGLGNAIYKNGDSRKAVTAYRKALEIDPSNYDAYCRIGNALLELGDIEEAAREFNKVIEVDRTNLSAFLGQGRVLSEQGEPDKAISKFLEAIEINPEFEDAYVSLANLLGDQGQIEEAIARYREAIVVNPKNANAYRSLAKIKKFSERDDDVLAMESLYAEKDIADEVKMHLAYGLGKVYEELGEHEKSIELVIEGASLNRALISYSASETEAMFAQIKEMYSTEFFSAHGSSGYSNQTPIFILGMPRSGTSLTEQILASHPEVFGAGELKYIPGLTSKSSDATTTLNYLETVADIKLAEFKNLGKEYITKIRSHSESAKYITDKMPFNFLHIGFIKAMLPNAKIVHVNRDPMDNALSIYKNFFGTGHNYSYDMVELGQFYKHYLELMEYWRKTLPGFIYDISYEGLVADLEGQTRLLLELCDLPWDDACLEFHKTRRKVKTASSAQVRHPIYKDSVKLWKRYEKQLQPLHDAIYN